jgi:hypothetical protein
MQVPIFPDIREQAHAHSERASLKQRVEGNDSLVAVKHSTPPAK